MLSPSLDTLRLFLHVLAAAVWVGGQLVMAGLVRSLRSTSERAPRIAAQAFARVARPAFLVVVLTGIWNLAEVDVTDTSTSYQVTVFVKLLVVAVSWVAAVVHASAARRSRRAVAALGATAAVGGVAALFLGVLLRSGT